MPIFHVTFAHMLDKFNWTRFPSLGSSGSRLTRPPADKTSVGKNIFNEGACTVRDDHAIRLLSAKDNSFCLLQIVCNSPPKLERSRDLVTHCVNRTVFSKMENTPNSVLLNELAVMQRWLALHEQKQHKHNLPLTTTWQLNKRRIRNFFKYVQLQKLRGLVL